MSPKPSWDLSELANRHALRRVPDTPTGWDELATQFQTDPPAR